MEITRYASVVAVAMPTGHELAKSLRRFIRRLGADKRPGKPRGRRPRSAAPDGEPAAPLAAA